MSGIYKEEYKFCVGCGSKLVKTIRDYPLNKSYDRVTGIAYFNRFHVVECELKRNSYIYHDDFILSVEKRESA